MSQDEKNSVYVVVILVALLGLVLSCCCGMWGGLVAGSWQTRFITRSMSRQRPVARPTLVTPQRQERPTPTRPFATPEIPLPPASAQPVPIVPEDFLKAGYPGGAVLMEVGATGPAGKAGLLRGDIIVGLDDKDVSPQAALSDLVHRFKPGDTVKVRYWRNGKERSASVTLDASPSDPAQAYLGVLYSPVRVQPSTGNSD